MAGVAGADAYISITPNTNVQQQLGMHDELLPNTNHKHDGLLGAAAISAGGGLWASPDKPKQSSGRMIYHQGAGGTAKVKQVSYAQAVASGGGGAGKGGGTSKGAGKSGSGQRRRLKEEHSGSGEHSKKKSHYARNPLNKSRSYDSFADPNEWNTGVDGVHSPRFGPYGDPGDLPADEDQPLLSPHSSRLVKSHLKMSLPYFQPLSMTSRPSVYNL